MYHSGCILIKSGSTTHLRHVYVRVSDNDDEYVQDYMLIVCVLNIEGIEMVGEN